MGAAGGEESYNRADGYSKASDARLSSHYLRILNDPVHVWHFHPPTHNSIQKTHMSQRQWAVNAVSVRCGRGALEVDTVEAALQRWHQEKPLSSAPRALRGEEPAIPQHAGGAVSTQRIRAADLQDDPQGFRGPVLLRRPPLLNPARGPSSRACPAALRTGALSAS